MVSYTDWLLKIEVNELVDFFLNVKRRWLSTLIDKLFQRNIELQ